MINICAKLEVPTFTYGNMKGNAKWVKYGDFGGQGSLKVISYVTIQQSAYDFLSTLIETMPLFRTVSELQ